MKTILKNTLIFLLFVSLTNTGCQKNSTNPKPDPSNQKDTTVDKSIFKLKLLNSHFWADNKNPEYSVGLRFYDNSFTYSFISSIYPSTHYDSVYDNWKVRAPDTLDLGRVGITQLLTLNDSTFTIRNFGSTIIYEFYKIY